MQCKVTINNNFINNNFSEEKDKQTLLIKISAVTFELNRQIRMLVDAITDILL